MRVVETSDPQASELRLRAQLAAAEARRIAAELEAIAPRLRRNIQIARDICEPPLFVHPHRQPWIGNVVSREKVFSTR